MSSLGAFRLRRLAQSVGRALVRKIYSGSVDMSKGISTAQARTKCGSRF